nr:succinyl-diaminopimelate desuccinylase [Chromatium okenii]
MISPTLALACDLISRPSVTPDDHGCQTVIAERLAASGFQIERLPYGDVTNLWARRGTTAPLLCFAGHTDVVPTGPLEQWSSPPFTPTVRDGVLYGRGAADMKGSVAAMVTAAETFVTAHPDHRGSLAFLLTSDEEGPSVNGTVKVMEWLTQRGETIDYALVGEPSSRERLGDTIKNGRRGSVTGVVKIYGKQGHVAYPQLALNPFHASVTALAALCAEVWDHGNAHFPPTSFQLANLHMGTGADNVIPGELTAQFNLRFSTAITPEQIQARVVAILDAAGLRYDLSWRLSGQPFVTPVGALVEATRAAIHSVTGVAAELSTSGGTSDGRFIAPTGAQVVELGPLNATIHQIDECVAVAELEQLTQIYCEVLERLLIE